MKNTFIVFLAALAIAGCGKGRSADPIANVREKTKDNDLQKGSWQSECNNTPLKALSEKVEGVVQPGPSDSLKSERIEYKFDGENVTRSLFRYHDTNCAGDAVLYTERGTIKIGDQRTNDQGRFIDMHFTDVMAVVKGPGLTVANTNKLCGISNWEDGKEANVTSASGKGDCYPIQTPRDVYNVYRVMMDKGELWLGADPAGGLPDRPGSATAGVMFKHKD